MENQLVVRRERAPIPGQIATAEEGARRRFIQILHADIVISCAREDRERVQAVAEILGYQGWSVWWDRTILPGRRFDEEIQHLIRRSVLSSSV